MAGTDHQTQPLEDRLDPARARALEAVLGAEPALGDGDEMPGFFHHVYFWEPLPAGALGRDGHPARGGLVPDLGLPRRMWAAGRLVRHAPLRLGIRATRQTTVEGVTRKSGRSGPLGFVTLRHDIRQRGQLCVTEWQELVYRDDPSPDDPPRPAKPAPGDADLSRALETDPVLLFRYSALTLNGHRIHYDAAYAREVEGHDGLVVHGPLLALRLLQLTEELTGPVPDFRYRATAPLIVGREARVNAARDGRAWISGAGGVQHMASWTT